MPFLDLVDKLYTSERDGCVIEALKAQHRPHSLFHSTVVLFNKVIYIFACPHSEFCRKHPFLLEFLYRLRRSCIAIERELLGEAPFFDRPLQELLSGSSITGSVRIRPKNLRNHYR